MSKYPYYSDCPKCGAIAGQLCKSETGFPLACAVHVERPRVDPRVKPQRASFPSEALGLVLASFLIVHTARESWNELGILYFVGSCVVAVLWLIRWWKIT